MFAFNNEKKERIVMVALAGVALSSCLTGCAKQVFAPKEAPLIVPYEKTADPIHVRDVSIYATEASRGGAAIRQDANIDVLWGRHYGEDADNSSAGKNQEYARGHKKGEGEGNKKLEKEGGAVANAQGAATVNGSTQTANIQRSDSTPNLKGKDTSIYAKKGKDMSVYAKRTN